MYDFTPDLCRMLGRRVQEESRREFEDFDFYFKVEETLNKDLSTFIFSKFVIFGVPLLI